MIVATSSTEELEVGRLTGFRCPECGMCVYVNLVGRVWCSRHGVIKQDLKSLNFLEIPSGWVLANSEARHVGA